MLISKSHNDHCCFSGMLTFCDLHEGEAAGLLVNDTLWKRASMRVGHKVYQIDCIMIPKDQQASLDAQVLVRAVQPYYERKFERAFDFKCECSDFRTDKIIVCPVRGHQPVGSAERMFDLSERFRCETSQ